MSSKEGLLVGIGAGREAGSEESRPPAPRPTLSLGVEQPAQHRPPPEPGSDIERMRTAAPYFAPVEKPMFCPQAGE